MGDFSTFQKLNQINVNSFIEKKNGLSYLSWPNAWAETMKAYPDAGYEVVKQPNGLPYTYDPNTGYMVYTRVTIDGVTREMFLPVMDGANKAMKAEPYTYYTGYGQYRKEKTCEAATMFDVNKAIMRCLVKNLAMFGLGLYIYAGEDLPEGEQPEQPQETAESYAADADALIIARSQVSAAISDYMKKTGKAKADVLNDLKAVPGSSFKTVDGCNAMLTALKGWAA